MKKSNRLSVIGTVCVCTCSAFFSTVTSPDHSPSVWSASKRQTSRIRRRSRVNTMTDMDDGQAIAIAIDESAWSSYTISSPWGEGQNDVQDSRSSEADGLELKRMQSRKQIEKSRSGTGSPWQTLEPRDYNDGALSTVLLYFLNKQLAAAVGVEPPSSPTYDSFVELARTIQVANPDPADQRAVVLGMLRGVLPAWFRSLYLMMFPANQFSAEFNAFMCSLVSGWLVGPSVLEQKEVVGIDAASTGMWTSTVKVDRCRFLEQSQCKGACMNLCKVPTETLFREELGMPLYMEPNFDDLSCVFTFGASPPPLHLDPLLKEPCYRECPATAMLLAQRPKPCHTMPEIPNIVDEASV